MKNEVTQLGILGAGQLAAMLRDAAGELPVKFKLLESPLNDPQALRDFLSDCDTVLFENEFVDVEALRRSAEGLKLRFFPDLAAIARVQDKLEQKRIFDSLGLPHPRYRVLREAPSMSEVRAMNEAKILKWSRQGYDGKGVFRLDAHTPPEKLRDFFAAAIPRGSQIYEEEAIDFQAEVALLCTQSPLSKLSREANFAFYPLVKSTQESGICERVVGPAHSMGVSPELESQAREIARKIGLELKLEGTFAVEFFWARDGRLLVNEVAPRVHNTGHYSQDATSCSQFANHLRAALGLELGPTSTTPYFLMLNMLGPKDMNFSLPAGHLQFPSPPPSLYLHWYDKKDLRPGRKLGHINGTAESKAELEKLLSVATAYRSECFDYLRGLKP